MKRIGHIKDKRGNSITLVEAMADYGNVQKSYNKARKGKRYRKDVIRFTKKKEENLKRVREDILTQEYKPGAYHYFKVYEPKERQIMALPLPLYAIKADIHHYFQSIDHGILKAEIRHVIKDKEALTLIDRIIDHNGNMPDGVGIPVGNLTSQLFANIYLDKLDRFIKHTLGVKPYERYMDDFILLSPDKGQLREWLAAIETFLRDELRLELNPKTTILAAKNGIDFVGYKHRGTHKKVRRDSIKRMKRKIKWYVKGKITKEKLQKSVRSWTGHASHADSYNLQKKILTLVARADEQTAAKAA